MTSEGKSTTPPTAATTSMTLRQHLRRTLRLAVPVVIARAGLLIMVAVDTAMVGHYSTLELAFYAASNAAQIVMILIGVGLLQGTVILVSQAHGAGSDAECGQFWRIGVLYGLFFGTVMALLCLFGEWALGAIGQTPELARGGGDVLRVIAWGFPGLIMWVATSFFLEGLSRPLPGMLVMLGAVLLNGALNWVFIYGNLGAPAMGAEGAAVATSAVRWAMLAALGGYVLLMRDGQRFGVRGRLSDAWRLAKKLRRLGYPLGAARGLEAAAFSALTMMAGLLGTVPLAGYQIALNLVALVFMAAIGTSTATTIRVGNAVGRRDATDVARAGWAGAILIVVFMLCMAGPFLGLGGPLAAIYSDDAAVLNAAVPLITIAGLVLVFDGAQAVLMGALRGVADVWVPPFLQLIAWWGIAVPVGYILGFVVEIGVDGLMWGLLAGTMAISGALTLRFFVVCRRPIARY